MSALRTTLGRALKHWCVPRAMSSALGPLIYWVWALGRSTLPSVHTSTFVLALEVSPTGPTYIMLSNDRLMPIVIVLRMYTGL